MGDVRSRRLFCSVLCLHYHTYFTVLIHFFHHIDVLSVRSTHVVIYYALIHFLVSI